MTRRTASYVTVAGPQERAQLARIAAVRNDLDAVRVEVVIRCRCAVSQTSVRSTVTLHCEKCGRPVTMEPTR
jgi:hypothetical protein